MRAPPTLPPIDLSATAPTVPPPHLSLGLVTRRDLAPFGDLLIDRVKQLLAGEEGASAVTPADYEEAARSFLCDVVLPQWLGLVPLAGALLARAAGDVHVEGHTDVQWDFRAPVRVSALPPSCPAARGASMVVYRGFPAYVRPDPPPIERYLTPTKVPGAAAPPDAHYMAIFEVTTTKKWSRGRESLLWRLETRLAVSLERAKAMQAEGATPLDITDVVAVVGVVGPFSCEESVNRLMARYDGGESAVPPNLRKLMDAARFIFVFQPFEDQIEGGRRAVNVAGGAGAAAGTPATGTPPS